MLEQEGQVRERPVGGPPEGIQIWHYWPNGWPPRKGERAACGASTLGQPKRDPHEICVVCTELAA